MMAFVKEMHTFVIPHCKLLLGDSKTLLFFTFDWQVVLPTKGFNGGMSESLHEMSNMTPKLEDTFKYQIAIVVSHSELLLGCTKMTKSQHSGCLKWSRASESENELIS